MELYVKTRDCAWRRGIVLIDEGLCVETKDYRSGIIDITYEFSRKHLNRSSCLHRASMIIKHFFIKLIHNI